MFLELLESKPRTPARPWKARILADEATVGNVLSSDLTRKAWMIYWSFLDRGLQILQHENTWMVLGVLRTKLAEKVKGNFSEVMRTLLSSCFFGENSNMTTTGFLVKTSSGTVVGPVFGELGFIVGDDKAHDSIWQVKGASGNLNCLLCQNVVRVASEIARHDEIGYLFDHAEGDFSKFHFHNDATIKACYDKIAGAAPN